MRRRLTLLGVLPLLAGGVASAVGVPVPFPPAAAAALCTGLKLPAKLHGQTRRSTDPTSPLTAAWGSPAIALRCGVPRPAAMHLASQLVLISGMSWFAEPADGPVTFTAVGIQADV